MFFILLVVTTTTGKEAFVNLTEIEEIIHAGYSLYIIELEIGMTTILYYEMSPKTRSEY